MADNDDISAYIIAKYGEDELTKLIETLNPRVANCSLVKPNGNSTDSDTDVILIDDDDLINGISFEMSDGINEGIYQSDNNEFGVPQFENGVAEQNDISLASFSNDQVHNNLLTIPILVHNDSHDPFEINAGSNNSGRVVPQSGIVVAGESYRNQGSSDARPLAVWIDQPEPFWCSCCTVLREIVHTNGYQLTKLEIHGTVGVISHAVLEIDGYAINHSFAKTREMFDFTERSNENVKDFLGKYCEERKQSGYIMMPDPLSTFYEALYVGLNSGVASMNQMDKQLQTEVVPNQNCPLQTKNDLQNPHSGGTTNEGNPQSGGITKGGNPRRRNKLTLAEKKQKIAQMTINDIVILFGLPIEEAASKIDLSPTIVKKLCRDGGVDRWPQRKVNSLRKQIEKMKPKLNSFHIEDRIDAQLKIEECQQELKEIYETALANAMSNSSKGKK
ncbi:hypothetical protein ACFE04_017195 [Oxalis oulophora]